MSKTIPNQILHYTASAAGYPRQAIRVGNFAFSDAGNNPSGAWGIFRAGLNPKAFTANEDGVVGFEQQTYVVYIQKTNCVGPACYLINNTKDIPNTSDDYVGYSPPYKPWYNLIKFTQYYTGFTGSFIGNLIGTYSVGLNTDLNSSNATLNTTFKWYADQLGSISDPSDYLGGTAGNRIVVNKFYPPIIANTASRIFDSSFIPSTPMVPGVQLTGKIYNLAGLTHGNIGSNELMGDWDFEGGWIATAGGGLVAFEIPSDTGFCMSSGLEPTSWTLNMYVRATNHSQNYNNFFVKSGGQPDTSTMYWGLGYRNPPSGGTKLTMSWNRQDGVSDRQDYTLDSATISLNTWYFISVVRNNNSDWKTYINGKWVHTNNPSLLPTPIPSNFDSSFTNISQATASVLYHLNNSDENGYKNFQYFSYYPINSSDDAIRENFLRYALNSKIRNSNIKIALDTGTKVSTTGVTQWTDISGNELHAIRGAGINWAGYKPRYTLFSLTITHKTTIDNFFINPFCLSIWVNFVDKTVDSLIFVKGANSIELDNGTIFVQLQDTSAGARSFTSSPVENNRWYNIFVTGLNVNNANVYIFSHDGSNEVIDSDSLSGPSINLDDDINNIVLGDTSTANVKVASLIYWNSRFSQALCNDFFAIQKGRFGYDSNENRIADFGICT